MLAMDFCDFFDMISFEGRATDQWSCSVSMEGRLPPAPSSSTHTSVRLTSVRALSLFFYLPIEAMYPSSLSLFFLLPFSLLFLILCREPRERGDFFDQHRGGGGGEGHPR